MHPDVQGISFEEIVQSVADLIMETFKSVCLL
jgi:hypothetical protein